MNLRVVLESQIEPHARELYTARDTAPGLEGFAQFDAAALAFYAREGYLLIKRAFLPELVEAARQELQSMVTSDDPQCESIYYEGSIRERMQALAPVPASLAPASLAAASLAGESLPKDLALGETQHQLPDLPPEIRAAYVRKFMGFIPTHAPLAALAEHPQLLAILENLIGAPIRLFQDMAMIKPPQGREKPWHQDHAYFNLPLETRIAAAWIALDAVDTTNGCMYLLPGKHLEGPRLHFMRRDWQLCDTETLGREQLAVPMAAGDVLLFDAKLPHGTPTNFSNKHRWALQLHYVPRDVTPISEADRLAVFGSEGKNVSC
jgi:phytanoyl-CoA hydroxylase